MNSEPPPEDTSEELVSGDVLSVVVGEDAYTFTCRDDLPLSEDGVTAFAPDVGTGDGPRFVGLVTDAANHAGFAFTPNGARQFAMAMLVAADELDGGESAVSLAAVFQLDVEDPDDDDALLQLQPSRVPPNRPS